MLNAEVAANLRAVKEGLPNGVRLVAVSKFHPAEHIEAAYAAGQRLFGESHEQELSKKYDILPKDIEWHFIGHLQTNKVKYIAPYISMIDAVDSMKLLKEINKQAAKTTVSSKCCSNCMWQTRLQNMDSRSMPAGRCLTKANGANLKTLKYADSWQWRPILQTKTKSDVNSIRLQAFSTKLRPSILPNRLTSANAHGV